MRNSLAILLVAGAAGVASAQPSEALVLASPPVPASASGMWLDFGAGATRIDPGNGQTYRGEYVRFAPQVTISRMFYLGAEIDIGSFDLNSGAAPNASVARGDSSGTSMPMSDLRDGGLAAAKLVGGARMMAGAFSGGLEVAAGVRYATIGNDTGDNTNTVGVGVVEARGRLDVWLTPHLTVGALAGTDIVRRDEATFALNVGFHFEPFDHTRRY